jgi:hypothetical protein
LRVKKIQYLILHHSRKSSLMALKFRKKAREL